MHHFTVNLQINHISIASVEFFFGHDRHNKNINAGSIGWILYNHCWHPMKSKFKSRFSGKNMLTQLTSQLILTEKSIRRTDTY